jgi:hypothetical protein
MFTFFTNAILLPCLVLLLLSGKGRRLVCLLVPLLYLFRLEAAQLFV